MIRRSERPSSTVFELEARFESGRAERAFAKTYVRPTSRGSDVEAEVAQRTREMLETAGPLGERFAARAGGHTQLAPVLATDVEQLSIVTGAVAGRQLGAPRALSPAARRSAVERYQAIGRALRLIEDCSHPDAPPLDRHRVEAKMQRAAGRCQALTSSQRDRLMEQLGSLLEGAIPSDGRARYAHGDMSATNVFVDGTSVSLIDVGWIRTLPGYDVANFTFRLEAEPRGSRRWVRTISDALLDGYGREILDSPAWAFHRLHRLAWAAGRNSGRRAAVKNGERSLGELRGLLR